MHYRYARVGHRDQVVGRDRARPVEPERGELVQHLTLERKRADHDVEARDAVGHDDRAAVALHVAVADLAFLARSESIEFGAREGARALVAQQSRVGAHGGCLDRFGGRRGPLAEVRGLNARGR